MKQSAVLINPVQAHQALTALIWPAVKSWLICNGTRLRVEVTPEKRSDRANRMLHATIGEIASQLEWAGAKRDAEVWKRLLVAAWCRTRGDSVEILPALDGHGVDIVPARTSKLSRAEAADLQDFIYAWGAEQGVRFKAPEGWQ